MWRLRTHGDRAWLRSLTFGVRWPHRKPMRAHCLYAWSHKVSPRAFLDRPHTAPVHDHTCGVWALRSEREALWQVKFHNEEIMAVGRVNLWGRIVEGTVGWRAEYAYPIEIRLLYQLKDKDEARHRSHVLEAAYGVPVLATPRSHVL